MKIAFVGKGGSGKSTVAALFFLELTRQKKNTILIDADLNMHVRDLISVKMEDSKNLSLPQNVKKIQTHLIGTSTHISSPEVMYYSTPPSKGCNLLTIKVDDFILQNYFTAYHETGYIGEVGTYEKDVIGTTCYHTNLVILENLLRFSAIAQEEYLLVDMVAGVDAFANTLYAQFDVFVLVVEPTTESVAVYNQYLKLAEECGIRDRLRVVYNRIQDATDSEFLDGKIAFSHRLTSLIELTDLKQLRRLGKKLDDLTVTGIFTPELTVSIDTMRSLYTDPNERLQVINQLHAKCSQEDWITHVAGDISTQIDPDFRYA
jgi:CO dehydrogenase maturation factor